jgi:glutaredoxin
MVLSWLRSWWRGRQPVSLNHWQVVMFTRAGCHLCDIAWDQLCRARDRHGFVLTKVDVDTEPELKERHGLHVPVVQINGKVRFSGRINAVLLQRLIEAEQ